MEMMSSCLDSPDEENLYLDQDRISFIQSLKAVGNSFALVRQSNGDPTYLMYEGLSDGDHSHTRLTRSLTRTNQSPPNYINAGTRTNKKPKNHKNYSDDGKDFYDLRPRGSQKSRGVRGLGCARKRKGRIAEKESICIIKSRGGGQGNRVVKETSICIMETQGDQVNGAPKEIVSLKLEAPDYDDSYRPYDICLNKIAKLENGNAETSSGSELEVLDKDPQCSEWKYTPLSVSDVLDNSMEEDDLQYIGERSKPENPQFRKDVEDILRRPYDEKEYETLWLQMNSRKPVQGYRELRGHLKAYAKDALGKSYLDEYLDIRIKLDTFETDPPRRLNVLRGFFYYLKNIANDGIFKPWLDESCLALVPTTQ